MSFQPGDKIKLVCDTVGTVLKDPVHSQYSLLCSFDGQLVRIPKDGGIGGIRAIHLEKVEDAVTMDVPGN